MAVIKESPSKSGQGYDDLNRHNEDTKHPTQLKTIFYYLNENIATTSMVFEATGVPKKCITRYKKDLEKAELLWEVEKKLCRKTGFRAWYLTTNPQKAPKRQSELSSFGREVQNAD